MLSKNSWKTLSLVAVLLVAADEQRAAAQQLAKR